MLNIYLATRKSAAKRLSGGIPDIEITRSKLDILGTNIFEALGQRKPYSYSAETYIKQQVFFDDRGINPDISTCVYPQILEKLCTENRNFDLTPKIKKIDFDAMRLLQERILKAYEVILFKIDRNLPIHNGAREEEVLRKAAIDSETYGIDSQIGQSVMKIIIQETKELEEIIRKNYYTDFAKLVVCAK